MMWMKCYKAVVIMCQAGIPCLSRFGSLPAPLRSGSCEEATETGRIRLPEPQARPNHPHDPDPEVSCGDHHPHPRRCLPPSPGEGVGGSKRGRFAPCNITPPGAFILPHRSNSVSSIYNTVEGCGDVLWHETNCGTEAVWRRNCWLYEPQTQIVWVVSMHMGLPVSYP